MHSPKSGYEFAKCRKLTSQVAKCRELTHEFSKYWHVKYEFANSIISNTFQHRPSCIQQLTKIGSLGWLRDFDTILDTLPVHI